MLTDTDATLLTEAAITEAKNLGVRVCAVVIDAGGNLLAVRRQHDSFLSTFDLARKKAFTATNFGVDTHTMVERLSSDMMVHATAADGRLSFIMGGCAIRDRDQTLGGIGVSGASADQDLQCAHAALEAWSAQRPAGT